MNIYHYFLALSVSTSLFCSKTPQITNESPYQITVNRKAIDNIISDVTVVDKQTKQSFTKWFWYDPQSRRFSVSYSGDITTPLVAAMKEFEKSNTNHRKRK